MLLTIAKESHSLEQTRFGHFFTTPIQNHFHQGCSSSYFRISLPQIKTFENMYTQKSCENADISKYCISLKIKSVFGRASKCTFYRKGRWISSDTFIVECCTQKMYHSNSLFQHDPILDIVSLEVQGPSGPRLLAGGPSGLLTSSQWPSENRVFFENGPLL